MDWGRNSSITGDCSCLLYTCGDLGWANREGKRQDQTLATFVLRQDSAQAVINTESAMRSFRNAVVSEQRQNKAERGVLTSRLVPAASIDGSLLVSMYTLFRQYYADVSLDRFKADLSEKTSCLLLYDGDAKLCGFTSMQLESVTVDGRPVRVIFSGDTIVERRYWGDLRLAFDWIAHAGALKREQPQTPLYWFLIVKGHRTFRYLPAFTFNFHPHPSGRNNPELKRLLDMLAQRHFGDSYDGNSELIKFSEARGRLKPLFAEIDERTQRSPAVQFFLARNPGYRRGDELACITELCESNLRSLAARVFRKGMLV